MKSLIFTAAVLCLALCLSMSSPVLAVTRYVDGSVSASGDGTSWETPFKRIQEGIDASSDGDTVLVAEGIYVENIRLLGKNICLRSTDPLTPDVVANTIIDGNKTKAVVTFAGTESETCRLSGFTIRNGDATTGGGIDGGDWDNPTHATIRNNVITGNSARTGGGLAYCNGRIEHNLVSGNDVSGSYCVGGGLASCHGTIANNRIIGNSASPPDGGGGGLIECDGFIAGNLIAENTAVHGGGLIGCDGTIQNNMISGNLAWAGGGLYECDGTILNNTIVDNSGEEYDGGLGLCYGMIRNCVIWGNTAAGVGSQVASSSTPSYCCIQAWIGGGIANVTESPLFLDAPNGDYRLAADSPCVDGGVNGYWSCWPQRDMDGNCRLIGAQVDMGCYEHGSLPDSDGDLLSDDDESSLGTAPDLEDTDGDGLRDGLEVLRGSNPREATRPGTLHVPSDLLTVQEALCVAVNGDEILVASGTYRENVCFLGVNVILRSCDPGNKDAVASTVLEGDGMTPVVSFVGSESEACVLAGLTIQHGRASAGGGICGGSQDSHTHATIERNTITGNSAWKGGGLAYCDGDISYNRIIENSADGYDAPGGGLYGCNGLIQGNVIRANVAADRGGGLCECDGTIRSNLIVANSARGGGGMADCEGIVDNNTIYRNSASRGSGLYHCFGLIRNCVIWETLSGDASPVSDSSDPSYSCIQSWNGGGVGNISGDPRFVDPDGQDDDPDTFEDNNYRLISKSPCIDAGDNSVLNPPGLDMDSNLRIAFGAHSLTVDMGAYELRSPRFMVTRATSDGSTGFQILWNSQPNDTYTIRCCDDLLAGEWVHKGEASSEGVATTWADSEIAIARRFYKIEMK